MAAKNESSVLFALSELQSLESTRQKQEEEKLAEAARQEEQRRREERESARRREELRAAQARHEQLVAAEEARQRLAEEGRARELAERAQKLEQELRVGHAERELLYKQVSHFESVEAMRKGRRRATVVAAIAGVAVCCAVFVAAWTSESASAGRAPVPAPAPSSPRLQAEKTELAVRQAVATQLAQRLGQMETQLDTLRGRAAELEAQNERLLHRPTSHAVPSSPAKPAPSLSEVMKACGDDPICGLRFKK